MIWSVGDIVRSVPGHSEKYENESGWIAKMSARRLGVVVGVPDYTREHGSGTLLIEWASLTEIGKSWRRWIHSDAVERVEA